MKKRAFLILGLACAALLWTVTVTQAQDDMIVTNLAGLAQEAFNGDHCLYLPGTSGVTSQHYYISVAYTILQRFEKRFGKDSLLHRLWLEYQESIAAMLRRDPNCRKTFPFLLLLLTLHGFVLGSASAQTVVTFDDLGETASGSFFSSQYQGYEGLTWSNILCNNALLFTNLAGHMEGGIFGTDGLSGDYYGMVSPSNVAIMVSGCEIDSMSSNFNFMGAYLTGFYNSNLNIQVEGFNGSTLLYDSTVVAAATNAALFTFNYLDINRLYFTSSGGEGAFESYNNSSEFIMDNFMFEFIPEPSSFLMTALGTVSLVVLLRRRPQRQGLLS